MQAWFRTLRSAVAIFAGSVVLWSLGGCITASVLIAPTFEEERLMHAGRYRELVSFYEHAFPPLERRRIQQAAFQSVVHPTLAGVVEISRFEVAQKWLPRALVEIGDFARARTEIVAGKRYFLTLRDLQISTRGEARKSTLANLLELRSLEQYLDWFERGNQGGLQALLQDPEPLLGLDPAKQLPILTERAFIYDKVFGNGKRAIELLDQVLAIADGLGVMDVDARFAYSLQAYKRKAWIQVRLGLLGDAKKTLESYATTTKSLVYRLGKTTVGDVEYFRGYLVTIECTAGAVYALSHDFETAEKHFAAAREALRGIPVGSEHMWDRNAFAAYHVLYGAHFQAAQGMDREGLESVRQGLHYLRPAYVDALSTEIDIETAHLLTAQLHLQVREFDYAVQHANNAHALARRYHSAPSAARASSILGAAHLEQGRTRQAMEYYRRAESEVAGIESAENWYLFHGLAQAHRRAGSNGLALRAALRAVDEVEKLWAGRFDEVPRQVSIVEDRLVVYEGAIELLVEQQRWEDAFGVMEKAKARTAYDTRSSAGERESAPLSPASPMSYSDIRRTLHKDTTLVEYFVGSRIVVGMAISSREALRGHLLAIKPADLKAKIEEYRAAVSRSAGQSTLAPIASDLYMRILNPFEAAFSGSRYVGIIPHGPMHALPFHALHGPNAIRPYLIERHALFYAPSATLLARSRSLATQTRSSALVLASPPEVSAAAAKSEEPLYKLTAAEAGGRSAAGLFQQSTLFTDTGASESNARNHLPRHQNIIIAAHAVVRPEDPQRSGIFLAPDQSHDGILTVQEIEQLSLRAALVVLSGCTTAYVTPYAQSRAGGQVNFPLGDDLVSINRAFMRAGAGSVVSALWRVDDDATEELMLHFLQHYVAGRTRADALRAAMLVFLDRNRPVPEQHPYYWAAWTVSGEWR